MNLAPDFISSPAMTEPQPAKVVRARVRVRHCLYAAALLLAGCGHRDPQELSRRQQKRVEAARDTALVRARRDSTRAQGSLTAAARHYREAEAYQDSATYYAQHEKPIPVAATDTARIQRLLAEIFGR